MAPRAVRDGDRVHVVWCSAPAWRLHQRVDQMRSIELRTVDLATGAVADGPGTDGGLLPVATRAAPRPKSGMLMNVTPSNPRIAAAGAGNLACTVRVHDPDHPRDSARGPGQRGFALPLWCAAAPERGRVGRRRRARAAVEPDHARAGAAGRARGLTLVYGDLHEHSSLSSCYAMNDGSPADNLRWRGDALGDRVLTFTEHIRMSGADFIHERGARIGFCGGSDHAGNSPSSTGFWVREVSGPGVFEALRERRTIACCRGKIALWTRVDGQPMGSVVEAAGAVVIETRIASPVPIATVSLWRNDHWLEHRAVTGDRIEDRFTYDPGPGEHHYVVRAQSTADDLPAGPLVAYSSPTYVRSGSGGTGGT